ncbi:MAG: hypothetical protein RL095_3441 [Verrucomicrobiota bacterium]|jgi:hypothetical protein
MNIITKSSILRSRHAVGALLLFSFGGACLWTQKPAAEISGKNAEASHSPRSSIQAENTSAKITVRESPEARVAGLLKEAKALLDEFDELSIYISDEGSCDWDPKSLGKLRLASRTPEFRRWHEIVKEIIEIGPVPGVEALRCSDASGHGIFSSYQFKQISWLEGLSRLDGDEADPDALREAFKLNAVYSSCDPDNSRINSVCCQALHYRLADTLEQQSSEALSDFVTFLQDSSFTQPQAVSSIVRNDRQKVLDLLKDPKTHWSSSTGLVEDYTSIFNSEEKTKKELREICRDSIQMHKLQQLLKDLDSKFYQTWEQGSNWPQRLQAVQDFQKALDERLDFLSGDCKAVLTQLITPSETTLQHLIDIDAQRQALAAALRVKKFHHDQGRLPATLEEAGVSQATTLSYKIKDGKVLLSTSQKGGHKSYLVESEKITDTFIEKKEDFTIPLE